MALQKYKKKINMIIKNIFLHVTYNQVSQKYKKNHIFPKKYILCVLVRVCVFALILDLIINLLNP